MGFLLYLPDPPNLSLLGSCPCFRQPPRHLHLPLPLPVVGSPFLTGPTIPLRCACHRCFRVKSRPPPDGVPFPTLFVVSPPLPLLRYTTSSPPVLFETRVCGRRDRPIPLSPVVSSPSPVGIGPRLTSPLVPLLPPSSTLHRACRWSGGERRNREFSLWPDPSVWGMGTGKEGIDPSPSHPHDRLYRFAGDKIIIHKQFEYTKQSKRIPELGWDSSRWEWA